MVLWAGHCVTGCCIRAKVAHFQISLLNQQANRKIADGDSRPGLIISLPLMSDLRMHDHLEVASGLNAVLKAWVLCRTYETTCSNLLMSDILSWKRHSQTVSWISSSSLIFVNISLFWIWLGLYILLLVYCGRDNRHTNTTLLSKSCYFGFPSSYQVLWAMHDGLMNSSPPISSFLFHLPAFTSQRLVY